MSRLHTLLRLRGIQERQARGRVGEAETAVQRAEREAEERARVRLSWAVPHGVPVDVAGLRRHQLETLALHDAEAAAIAEAAAVRLRRDRAVEGWSQTRTALRSVERLEQHRAAIQAAEAAARAQAAADELALLVRRRPERER